MLGLLVKRLCPLMTLVLTFSCGKKINEPQTTLSRTQTQELDLPSLFTLRINEAESPIKMFQLPRNAWFKMPTHLYAHGGDVTGKTVRIFYNVIDDLQYEFHCTYKSLGQSEVLSFTNCETENNVQIISNSQDVEKMEFPMDKGLSLKMQLMNPSGNNTKIDSTYQVDWK